jgi:hypothetical protein
MGVQISANTRMVQKATEVSRLFHKHQLSDEKNTMISRHKNIIGLDIGTRRRASAKIGDTYISEIGAGILTAAGDITVETFKTETEDGSDELQILQTFENWMKQFPTGSILASYNGYRFDIPILLMRSWQNNSRLPRLLGKFHHFDVLIFLRKLKKEKKMKSIRDPLMGLKFMEQFFGYERTFYTRRESPEYLVEDVTSLLFILKGFTQGGV